MQVSNASNASKCASRLLAISACEPYGLILERASKQTRDWDAKVQRYARANQATCFPNPILARLQ
jgi:hypothetical protein